MGAANPKSLPSTSTINILLAYLSPQDPKKTQVNSEIAITFIFNTFLKFKYIVDIQGLLKGKYYKTFFLKNYAMT